MTPWEVIEEALAHRRPRRTFQWLAEQLGIEPQAVGNWKSRGVPPRRYRDIAAVLGLSLDQLEGIEELSWLKAQQSAQLLPDVAVVADEINRLPDVQRDFVLDVIRRTLPAAKLIPVVNANAVATNDEQNDESKDKPSSKRRRSR